MVNKLKNFIKTIKGAVVSSYMCLRFPFLYTHNAATGLHKTCWKIRDYHREHYRNCIIDVYVETKKVDQLKRRNEIKREYDVSNLGHNVLSVLINRGKVYLYKDDRLLVPCIIVNDLFEKVPSEYNIDLEFDSDKRYLRISIKHTDGKDYDYDKRPADVKFIHTIVTNVWKYRWIKFLDWIEKYPYQWINCIPTHSWYDSIPYGWRKTFGISLMKELKTELLRVGGRKALKSLNISTIKEKWGSLQIYCTGPGNVQEIIEKYEYISFRTCIDCGRPAYGITKGYVLPYCKECFEKSRAREMVPFFSPSNNWYGYVRSNVGDLISKDTKE